MQQISSGRLFNIHSRVDLVVAIDGGAQTYVSTPVAASETVKIIAFAGHSDSHDSRKWDSRNVPPLVQTVCP